MRNGEPTTAPSKFPQPSTGRLEPLPKVFRYEIDIQPLMRTKSDVIKRIPERLRIEQTAKKSELLIERSGVGRRVGNASQRRWRTKLKGQLHDPLRDLFDHQSEVITITKLLGTYLDRRKT